MARVQADTTPQNSSIPQAGQVEGGIYWANAEAEIDVLKDQLGQLSPVVRPPLRHPRRTIVPCMSSALHIDACIVTLSTPAASDQAGQPAADQTQGAVQQRLLGGGTGGWRACRADWRDVTVGSRACQGEYSLGSASDLDKD